MFANVWVSFVIFRQLTALGDWTFGQGISGYATLDQAIELNVKTRLLSWVGDCFFALLDFVDWLGRLDKGQEAHLGQELRQVILASYGVSAITAFDIQLNRQTRACVATYTITTIFGKTFTNTLNLQSGLPTGS